MGGTALVLVTLVSLCMVARGQECLPGQQACLQTCCDTGKNFTCCPYRGGYCAPPGKICCEDAFNGVCDADKSCCKNVGCYDKDTQQCCTHFDKVCDLGGCCRTGSSSGQCVKQGNQCCDSSPYSYQCNATSDCCSVNTCTGSTLQDCCEEGTVCCPAFSPGKSIDSSHLGDATANRAKEASSVPQKRELPTFLASVTPRSCANAQKEFCCGGYACPTQTLCCEGNGHINSYSGCCYGYASNKYSCDIYGRCP